MDPTRDATHTKALAKVIGKVAAIPPQDVVVMAGILLDKHRDDACDFFCRKLRTPTL
jgi:hypothetical protein